MGPRRGVPRPRSAAVSAPQGRSTSRCASGWPGSWPSTTPGGSWACTAARSSSTWGWGSRRPPGITSSASTCPSSSCTACPRARASTRSPASRTSGCSGGSRWRDGQQGPARAGLEPRTPQACSVHVVMVPTSGCPPKAKAGSRRIRLWGDLRPSGLFSLPAILFTYCRLFLTSWHLRREPFHCCIKITPQIERLRTTHVTSPQDLGGLGISGRLGLGGPSLGRLEGSCCRAWLRPRGLRGDRWRSSSLLSAGSFRP